MTSNEIRNDRIEKLISAFNLDGFDVDEEKDVFLHEEKIGIVATHKTATIGTTGKKKKVFYVEGAPYDMGYLMGQMAEPQIERMCTEFNQNIIFDFISLNIKDEPLRKILGSILDDIFYMLSLHIYPDVPADYKQELEGMLDGCNEVHPSTKVSRHGLWLLNVGIDAALSFIYTLKLPLKKKYPVEIRPEHLRVPIACNGFAVFGEDNQKNKFHYMGRDFMFPTAGVFQDTATMIVYRPDQGLPFVAVAAPGIIGSIAAVNSEGVGIGVNMSPSGNCNPGRPGINSLLLNRHSIQHGEDGESVVDLIVEAQRGVSWNYILAGGKNDTACIVEAGETTETIDFLSYPPEDLREGILKPAEALLQNPSTPIRRGLMVRGNDYVYPDIYASKFNEALFATFKANPKRYEYLLQEKFDYDYQPEDFADNGYLNKTWTDKHCPMAHYFAPQREHFDNLILTTNHFIIPEMRLCSMSPVSNFVAQWNWDDFQWRYDELHHQLLNALNQNFSKYNQSFLAYEEAKQIIDFLAPYNRYPDYYNKDHKPMDQLSVHGSVSLLDLKKKTIESHYGYYSDQWLKISLENYL
ncbi:MAG TPA: hypothetical protein VK568_14530 [Thermodesulfobacteriota bacterium]|nr:hypothetical protein [Thermodesulfobacteriota bacterium]